MSDAAIFIVVFGGIFAVRILAATIVFMWILPAGDRCPNCDYPTLRVEPTGLDRLFVWLRPSWCYQCGWEGMLRKGTLTPLASPAAVQRQEREARTRG